MTTGSSYSSIVDPPFPETPRWAIVVSKSWSGDNGKWNLLVGGKRIRKVNPYTMSYSRTSISTIEGGFYFGIPTVLPVSWSSNDEIALLGNLAKTVRGHEFNLAVAAGEAGKTLELVTSTLMKFYKSIRLIRRGNLTGAARLLTGSPKRHRDHKSNLTTADVSDAWLEMAYGWTPLLQDVYNSSHAYAKLTAGPRTKTFRVAGYKSASVTEETSPGYWGWNKKARIVRAYEVTLIEDMTAARSLGLLDPLSLAWELTPFSFVADWFIPIGNYFEDLNAIPNLSGSCNLLDFYRRSGVGYPIHSAYQGCTGKYTVIDMTRSPAQPLSSLNVPFPEFKPLPEALSLRHLENGLALLRSVL